MRLPEPTGATGDDAPRSLAPRLTASVPMPRRDMPRREWLASAISVVAIAGCGSKSETSAPEAETVRTDVPLRVVWVGQDSDAETLRRTWSSISEQPLDVRVVPPPRSSIDANGEELFNQAASTDVLIYPLAMMAELVGKKRLMPLLKKNGSASGLRDADDVVAEVFASAERTSLQVALRTATSYSGERLAAPLGGHLPALLLGEGAGENTIATWADYDAFVQSSDGRVCEPTAPSWAAAMYLWRLASSLTATWLFERESLAPLFNEPEYVAVLQQMAATVKRSQDASGGRSPSQIYDAVSRGELIGGIGFPQSDEMLESVMVRLENLPAGSGRVSNESPGEFRRDLVRAMMDPFLLVGSLAASCRQTAAAYTFLDWIAGGEGSQPLYRNISSMIDTTTPPNDSSSVAVERYRSWLIRQLSSTSFVTTLQLPGAKEYYGTLDESVRSCVHGEMSATDACAEITDQWLRLHRKYDLPSQKRAWRRAQGIS